MSKAESVDAESYRSKIESEVSEAQLHILLPEYDHNNQEIARLKGRQSILRPMILGCLKKVPILPFITNPPEMVQGQIVRRPPDLHGERGRSVVETLRHMLGRRIGKRRQPEYAKYLKAERQTVYTIDWGRLKDDHPELYWRLLDEFSEVEYPLVGSPTRRSVEEGLTQE